VYIEFSAKKRSFSAIGGLFHIERFDPRGIRHGAVIRLYLNTIDLAHIGPGAARPDGFIPFAKLSRDERYAEVLGHEMAHAVWILSDLNRAYLVKEVIQKTNEIFLARRFQVSIDQDLDQRLMQRDLLLAELEAQAEAVELIIWLELICGRSVR
jgi:hypothetical protein